MSILMLEETDKSLVNFLLIEKELCQAIKEEERYKEQNEAKVRAIVQKVSTYDEFSEIVNAAHLKPLEKNDRFSTPSHAIWNHIAKQEYQKRYVTELQGMSDLHSKQADSLEGLQELERRWRHHTGNPRQQFFFLRCLGSERVKQLCNHFDLLGGIIQSLGCMEETIEDFCFVVDVLNSLSRAKRFALSLRFLNEPEKTQNRELFQKLWKCLTDNQQDLAEKDITELTLNNLMKRYQVED